MVVEAWSRWAVLAWVFMVAPGCATSVVAEGPFHAGEPPASWRLAESGQTLARGEASPLIRVEEPGRPQDEGSDEDDSDHEASLREKAQNPVANMISVPFQFNTTQNAGYRRNSTSVLNIQPVYPVGLNEDWNLINRLIVPLVNQGQLAPNSNRTQGLGDTTLQMFFSPKESQPIWGVGPILYFPTASDDKLGTDQWGLGPSGVVLNIDGPWLYGAVGQHLWSVGGPNGSGNDLNQSLVQPFVNYNMDDGWYLVSSPVVTANWAAANAGNVWNIPLGGGFGRLIQSKVPMNLSLQAFYNVHHPRNGGNWSARLQLALLFPKAPPRADPL
jgi:hypothetical protein